MAGRQQGPADAAALHGWKSATHPCPWTGLQWKAAAHRQLQCAAARCCALQPSLLQGAELAAAILPAHAQGLHVSTVTHHQDSKSTARLPRPIVQA